MKKQLILVFWSASFQHCRTASSQSALWATPDLGSSGESSDASTNAHPAEVVKGFLIGTLAQPSLAPNRNHR